MSPNDSSQNELFLRGAQSYLDALTAIAPLDPGSPLCRAHAPANGLDGLEIALKGGQVGCPDFLVAVRQGGREA